MYISKVKTKKQALLKYRELILSLVLDQREGDDVQKIP